jgi:hypothetical protein
MERRSADESFWVGLISEIENGLPFRDELSGLTMVNIGWSQEVQARVVVLLVVTRKELLAEKAHPGLSRNGQGNWGGTSWS